MHSEDADSATNRIIESVSKYYVIKEVITSAPDYTRLIVIPRELGKNQEYIRLLYRELIQYGYQVILKEEEGYYSMSIYKLKTMSLSTRTFYIFLIATLITVMITSYLWVDSWFSTLRSLGETYSLNEMITRVLVLATEILVILGLHETGHFMASKALKVPSTIPVFIPGPPGVSLGTFGAVIFMRALPPTLDDLAIIAMAGPLAGFLSSIIFSIYGLSLSVVVPETIATSQGAVSLTISPLIFTILGNLIIKSDHGFLLLSPEALAAYLLLLIHFMNLLPVGQLDGGQLARSFLTPRKHTTLGFMIIIVMLIFSLVTRDSFLVGIGIFLLIMFLLTGARPLESVSSFESSEWGIKRFIGLIIWVALLILTLPIPL